MHVDTLISLLETWVSSDNASEQSKTFLEIAQHIDCAGNVCIHGEFPEYTKHSFSMYGFYSPVHNEEQLEAVKWLLIELHDISITFAEEDQCIGDQINSDMDQNWSHLLD